MLLNEKIVDAVYRDRVQDMYEQFGYTPHYTLSESDYTLATIPNIEPFIDGDWVDCNIVLDAGATYPTTADITYDLSSYIPDDGYKYEVLLYGFVTPTKSSGAYLNLVVATNTSTSIIGICSSRAPSSTYSFSTCGESKLILPTDRKIIVRYNATYSGTYNLTVYGYRRIGKTFPKI